MAGPTREEIDAKFETAEARTETRFVELSGKIDRLTDSIGTLKTEVKGELVGVRADNKTTRQIIIVTVVASALAALAALWVTQANLLTAFTAGLAAHPEAPKDNATPSKTPAGGSG
jgi:hypothetical protein